LGLALTLGLATPRAFADDPPAARPQASADRVLPFKSRSFRIPFQVDEADRDRIKEVQLWVSTDLGRSWRHAGQTTPDQTAFPTYHAPREGEYWFAVRTLDIRGRLYPTDEAHVNPSMKVLVDTTPPTLDLAPNGRRGSRASVRWEVRDENLDPQSLSIEYKAEGARDWRQVRIQDFKLIGAEEWEAGTSSPLVVRARVDDIAGNFTVSETTLGDGMAAAPDESSFEDQGFEPPPPITQISAGSPPTGRMNGIAPGGPDPFPATEQPYDPEFDAPNPTPVPRGSQGAAQSARTLLVASPRFALQYAVEDAGPDGPALVELWITRDGGQTWLRQAEDPDRASPYDVDLGTEGTFGLWLVVQSAANLGDPPPRPGDRPQMWVEVDSTAPVVRLDAPRVGTGTNLGKVLITWRASDPHLGPRPVLLSYRAADSPNDPWHPITPGTLDNTGRYVWAVPQGIPPRIHLRIDVMDSVGNRAHAETQSKPVLVDRSRPRGKILGLDPNSIGGSGPDGRTRR
jgi:hypothetical protein